MKAAQIKNQSKMVILGHATLAVHDPDFVIW